MKKKLMGLIGLGCLLMAGQASASLVDKVAGYQGPLYYYLSGYSKSLNTERETWGVMTANGVFSDPVQTVINRLWVSSATDHMYGRFFGLADNYALKSETGFSIGPRGGTFTLYTFARGGMHDMLFSFNVLLPTKAAAEAGWSRSLPNPVEAHTAAPIPEPATMLLFGTGLISLALVGRRFSQYSLG